jgi:BetI-type transcriptional repressor, C-terminal
VQVLVGHVTAEDLTHRFPVHPLGGQVLEHATEATVHERLNGGGAVEVWVQSAVEQCRGGDPARVATQQFLCDGCTVVVGDQGGVVDAELLPQGLDNGGLFGDLVEAQAERYLTRMRSALADAVTSDDPIQRFIALASVVDDDDRSWFVLSTEFTLYAIRNPDAARALAQHDASLRQQLGSVLHQLMEASGRELLVNPALFVRFVVALREGASAQAYVEPDNPEPRMLESLFVPTLLITLSQQLPGQRPADQQDGAGNPS